MTRVQYFISLAVGLLCLIFSVLLLVTGQSVVKTQTRLAQQQEEINRGSVSQQLGQTLLRDMGQVALVNERVRQLLAENGYSISYTPPASNAAPATAAPAKK
jgi:type II secretory pathway pseudopilin PulG